MGSGLTNPPREVVWGGMRLGRLAADEGSSRGNKIRPVASHGVMQILGPPSFNSSRPALPQTLRGR